MLGFLLLCILSFLALTFFYKQSVHEFRLNQIEWSQSDKLPELLSEKVPIILRGRPPTAFWTQEDIHLRSIYSTVPVFQDRTLVDWIVGTDPGTVCPWDLDHARLLGQRHVSGLELWSDRALNPLLYSQNPLVRWWLRPFHSCWAGNKGLWKTVAPWTAVFVTQGALVCSIMTGAVESSLPVAWKDVFPGDLTAYDTPFVGDLKFIDIVIRPGSILFMPAHWFLSWKALDEGENSVCPMVCTVEYHSIVSRFAEWAGRRRIQGT